VQRKSSKMDRFTEQPASALGGNYARARFAEEIYESTTRPLNGPTCANCGATVDRVTLVPEFEYLGCDDCMAEALAVIARERAEDVVAAKELPLASSRSPAAWSSSFTASAWDCLHVML